MHHKDRILQTLFTEQLGATLVAPSSLDTDRFGTFTGEVPRPSEIKEVLRSKATAGMEATGLSLGLASEGSFGPHPHMPFLQCDQETLAFLDRQRNIEVFAHIISTDHCAQSMTVSTEQEAVDFISGLAGLGAGVILKPSFDFVDDTQWICKGLTSEEQVRSAYKKLRAQFLEGPLWIETDNRAHMSPPRQKVILQVAEKLVAQLKSLCPSCQTPGFTMTDVVLGLPCVDCGSPSESPLQELWSCPQAGCQFVESRGRQDGRTALEPRYCHWCNP
jgi:hypothetical protein